MYRGITCILLFVLFEILSYVHTLGWLIILLSLGDKTAKSHSPAYRSGYFPNKIKISNGFISRNMV